jgi:chromosome segregation ATPase
MATDAGRKTPTRGSVVGSINSPDGIAEVVRGFRDALKAFNSEQGFQGLAELVDRVPKLEEDVLEKERALKLAQETSECEREVRQSERQSSLQLYNAEYKRLETEKTRVEKHTMELQKSIAGKDQIIAETEAKVVSLKEAGRKIEEQYKSMQAKSKAKDGEILQLKHQNQDSHAKLDSLAAELQRSQGEVTSLNGSLQNMQQRNAQLGAALKEVQTQQEEMTSYSASLQDIEASQL